MRKTDKISAVPLLLELLQSKLWYNERYKVFFSKHHTNNPQEYYCFFLDVAAEERRHAKYRLTTDNVIVSFFSTEYKVKRLEGMLKYEIVMIQLINTKNELDYMNWMALDLPIEKGLPYTMKPLSAKREL